MTRPYTASLWASDHSQDDLLKNQYQQWGQHRVLHGTAGTPLSVACQAPEAQDCRQQVLLRGEVGRDPGGSGGGVAQRLEGSPAQKIA